MSKFVKKRALGGYQEVTGGQSDPECTHVILELEEYNQFLREKRQAEQEKREALADIQRMHAEAARMAQKAAEDVKGKITELEAQLALERRTAAFQREKNQDLIRICRERANADRKLIPKKEHTGYIVLESRMKIYRYRQGARLREINLWETRIQSPFSVKFTAEQVQEMIEEDLQEGENGTFLFNRIGIDLFFHGNYEMFLGSPEYQNFSPESDRNIMFSYDLVANYKAGYWEIAFFHLKPLGPVPIELLRKNQSL